MPAERETSLLDRMIARLSTQRAFLAHAASLIETLEGPILDVGLGKGRTFDHLRRLLPDREIFAFDRDLHAPEAATPARHQLFLGEFADTLPKAFGQLGRAVALVHADFGSPDRTYDARQAFNLGPHLQPLVRPGGIIVADRELSVAGWEALNGPPDCDWTYFMWRVRV